MSAAVPSTPHVRAAMIGWRACVSSSTSKPEGVPVAVDDDGYSLQNDVAYCLESVAAIADDDAGRLRVAVGRVITNPTVHRSELLALVIELAPPPAAWQ